MGDVSDLETRVRRLEESHQALARRLEALDSTEGAIRMHNIVARDKDRTYGWVLLGMAVIFAGLFILARLGY